MIEKCGWAEGWATVFEKLQQTAAAAARSMRTLPAPFVPLSATNEFVNGQLLDVDIIAGVGYLERWPPSFLGAYVGREERLLCSFEHRVIYELV